MSQPWENDPIVQPATQSSSTTDTPWASDPIVKAAPKQEESMFGSNRGVASPTSSISPEAAMNTTATLATSIPAAVLNAGKTIGALESGNSADQGGLDKEVTQMNATRAGWMQGNDAAKGMDIAGQVVVPLGAEAEGTSLAAKGLAKIPEWFTKGYQGLVGKGLVHVGENAAQGAVMETAQPHDNEPIANIESDIKGGAELGGGLGTVTGGLSLANTSRKAATNIGDKAAELRVGKNLPNVLGEDDTKQLYQHVANTDSNDMSVANATQSPNAASAEKALIKGTDRNDLDIRNQSTEDKLAGELQTAAPSIKAADTATAQEQVGAAIRDNNIAKKKEINAAYTAIAPDDTVQSPLESLQTKLDDIRDNNHELIHGDDDGKGADKQLAEISDRYNSTNKAVNGEPNTGSVKQMIADKNSLGAYIDGKWQDIKSPNLTSDQKALAQEKIDVATQMRDALKEHLSTMDNVPSALPNKSVGQAFQDAEGKYQDFRQKFLENPEQYQVNDAGQKYGYSSSAMGDTNYKQSKRTAGSLAEEGANNLPLNNPKALGAALKNVRNLDGADDLVRNNLLANIKDKGFEKGFTPEIEAQLEKNGFGDVAKDVKTQGILHDINSSVSTEANSMGKGVNNTVDYDKAFTTFNQHKDFLKANLPADQYNALETVHNELAKNSFTSRSGAHTDVPIDASYTEKTANIAIKGALSKIAGIPIGAASSMTLLFQGIKESKLQSVYAEALSNPTYAVQLIQQAKAANKDPNLLKEVIGKMYDAIPAAGSVLSNHTDSNLQKEINQQTPAPKPPIDKEVNDVTKPQADNSNANTVNSSSIPVSKKNNEFQVADASNATGMPPEYFNALEKAESQGQVNPDKASNTKSSAYGRSQFTEKTWNEVAAKHDLPQVTDDNRYTDNDPRSNIKYSRLAAGYYGAENADKLRPYLQTKLGRDTTLGDVYGAHLMGLNGFKQFISSAPSAPAADIVPMAAKNNASLFYDKQGNALSIRQVYRNIEDRLLAKSSDGEPDA